MALFFFNGKIYATQCLVVSGKEAEVKYDIEPKAFQYTSLLRSENIKIASLTSGCKIFGSWELLNVWVQGADENGDLNVQPEEPLLILQGAHGSSDGKFLCDDKITSSREVEDALYRLSADHPVAAIVESCYSGDLLESKLRRDLERPDDKTVDNLCLVTSSLFGLEQVTDDKDTGGRNLQLLNSVLSAKPGDSIEDVFKRFGGAGLISSAAWSSVGFDQLISNRDTEDAKEMLSEMCAIGSNCNNAVDRLSLQLCAFPSIAASDLDALKDLDFANKYVGLWRVDKWIELLEAKKKNETNRFFDSKNKCYRNAIAQLKTLRDEFQTSKYSQVPTVDFAMAMREFQSGDGFSACKQSGFQGWEDLPAPKEKDLTYHNVFTAPEKHIAYAAIQLVPALEVLERRLPGINIRELFKGGYNAWAETLTQALQSASESSDRRDKEKILFAMLGSGVGYRSIDSELGRNVGPHSALKGFVLGSLELDDLPSDLDQRRRNACRDFTL